MRTLHLSNTRSSPLRPGPKPEPHPTASPPDSALRRGRCPTDDWAPNVFSARTQTLPWMWLRPDPHPWTVVPHGFGTLGLCQADQARTEKETLRLAAPAPDGAGDHDPREQPTRPQDHEEHLPEANSEARRSPYCLPSTHPSGHFCAPPTARGLPYPGLSP